MSEIFQFLNSSAFIAGVGGMLYLQQRLTRVETQLEMVIQLLKESKS